MLFSVLVPVRRAMGNPLGKTFEISIGDFRRAEGRHGAHSASDDGLDRLRGDIEPEDDRADVGTVTIAARSRIRAFRTCGEFGVTAAGGGERL